MITALLVALVAITLAALFGFQVETDDGAVRLIDWLFGAKA